MNVTKVGVRVNVVAAVIVGIIISFITTSGLISSGIAFASDAKSGGTLVFARPEEPLGLNGFKISDNGSIWAIEQICDSLIEPDDSGYGLRPGLAESWEISDDGLVYTFHLRDAKFNTGEPVTIEDVLFSLDKAADPEGYLGFVFPPMKREAIDSKTLRMTLEAPFTPLLSAVSLFAAHIVDKESYEADEDSFMVNPVCSGPFKVESFERGNSLDIVRNEHYWDRQSYLDKVEMPYVPESNSRILGLKNGDYDAINVVPLNQAKALDADPGFILEVSPAFRLDYVYLNHARPPLDNKDIRLALNYAANREAVLAVAFHGFGTIPNSYMPIVSHHCDSVEAIPYDLEKARELVANSGYDGTVIEVIAASGDSVARQAAQILQQGWQEVGLNIEIVEFDMGTAYGKLEEGDFFSMVSYITSDTNDTDFLAGIQADHEVFGGFFSSYNNAQVTEWIQAAAKLSDSAARADLYCKVQQQVYWDGYSVPLNFKPFVNAHQTDVIGFHNSVTGPWWLKDVWLDR